MASLSVVSTPSNQPTLTGVVNQPTGIPSGPLPVVNKPAGVQAKLPVVSAPANVQQKLSVQAVAPQPTIAVPPRPPETPKMDKIASDIGVARSRGATDETILYRLVEKNPALTEPVKVAIRDRKATPSQVLDTIVAKYQAPAQEVKEPGILEKWDVEGFLKPTIDVLKGVGKSFAQAGNTGLKLLDKGYEAVTGRKPTVNALSKDELKAKGVFQNVGKITGDVLQAGAAAKAIAPVASAITKSAMSLKAPTAVQKLVDIGGRSALDAGAAYAVTKAQGYDNKDAKTAALISGALPWASAAFSTVAKVAGIKKAGEKIQYAVIKPTQADINNGFKIENVNRYNLGGSLKQTAQKTQDAITERATKLKTLLKPGSAKIDLNKVYYETVTKLEKEVLENAGSNIALKGQLDKFSQEMTQLSKDGIIDIADAQKIKRAFGAKGAWQFGIPAEDANAIEQVYNTAYNILKTDIETAAAKAGNAGVRQINKELSELIPIEHALIRRLPVATRQNPFSLTDLVSLIGGSKLGIPLFVLNRLTKSGTVGAKLAGIGSRPESRGALGTLVSGPGQKQLQSAPKVSELRLPKVNVGLSIKNVSPQKAQLRESWNRVQQAKLKATNKSSVKNYEQALKRIEEQARRYK